MKHIDRVLVLSLFGTYTIKAMVLGSSPVDVAIILILASAHFLYNCQIQNKKIDQVNQALEHMNNELNEIKELQSEFKTTMASVKISSGLMQKAR